MTYRSDIDGLRAIAVCSVVLFHFFPTYLTGGFIGVDVFFVISGYLITAIILQDVRAASFSIIRFYQKRIRRIFPALITVILACLIFGYAGMLNDELELLGKHSAAAALFLSNLVYLNESGYFDAESTAKPLLHLWSLGIEEQFYIVWPFAALLMATKFNKRWHWVAILIVCSLIYSEYAARTDGAIAYYSPLSRAWQLGAGALLAFIPDKHRTGTAPSTRSVIAADSAVSAGLLLILLSAMFLDEGYRFPGFNAVPATLGAVLLIYTGGNSRIASVVLANRLSVSLGRISYPWYLWHWPALSFGYIYYSEFPPRDYRVAAIVASLLLATATYWLVERPIRHSKFKLMPLTLVIAMATSGTLGWYIFTSEGLPDRQSLTQIDFSSEARAQFTGSSWEYIQNEQCLTDFPNDKAATLNWWFCMKSSERPPTTLLLGNSFANQLYPGFAANPQFSSQTFLSIGNCSFMADPLNIPGNPCYGEGQREQEDFIDELIRTQASLEHIIIDGVERSPGPDYIERFTTKVAVYAALGKVVVVFKPHLVPAFNPKMCFTTLLRKQAENCEFPISVRTTLEEQTAPLFDALRRQGIARIFDQNDVFCNEEVCQYVRENMPLYRDGRHTSEFASVLLQNYFTPWAEENIPELMQPLNTGR